MPGATKSATSISGTPQFDLAELIGATSDPSSWIDLGEFGGVGGSASLSGSAGLGWPGDSIFGSPSVELRCRHSTADHATIITNARLTIVFYPDPDSFGVHD